MGARKWPLFGVLALHVGAIAVGLFALRPNDAPSSLVLKAVFMAEMILIGQLAGLLPSRWWKRLTTACLLVTAVSLVIASFEVLRLSGVLPLVMPCGAVMAAMMMVRKFGVTASRQMQISSGV